MEKGVAAAGSDVVKYFDEASKEINEAAHRMPSLRRTTQRPVAQHIRYYRWVAAPGYVRQRPMEVAAG